MKLSTLMPSFRKEHRTHKHPLEALRREIDSIFERPSFFPSSFNEDTIPNMDICDKEDEVLIRVDTPGVSPDDLELSYSNGFLTIRGEKKREEKQEEENWYLLERAYGSFSRTIQLPFSLEPDDIKAKLKNGVLTIKLKKAKEARETIKKIRIDT